MVVLAYHRTYKLHRVLAMRLRVIFQIDPWSLYQLGFRSDHFLLVECQLQQSCVEVIHTRHNYGVLDWIVMSEFFYIPFLFFLQEYKVFGFIVVSLISFFSMSQLSNFLTFLSQASLHSTLVAIGYLFVSIPKASSALSLGLQWSLW